MLHLLAERCHLHELRRNRGGDLKHIEAGRESGHEGELASPKPEGAYRRIAAFGGVYSNHLALFSVVADAKARGAEALFCLGDLGAFGPNPDKVFPILTDNRVQTIRGNYDDSIARGLDDCQCGYTDPRDNHFARISYRYTFEKTSARWRRWLGGLPDHLRIQLARGASGKHLGDPGGRPWHVLMCHGSPRRMNEFLWESTTPTHFLERLATDFKADVILCTHTGIPWSRRLSHGRLFANVGAIGRPANDGQADVCYALISADEDVPQVQFISVAYDAQALAREMEEERLPEEFIETILSGWWTTCNEILPMKERRRGRF